MRRIVSMWLPSWPTQRLLVQAVPPGTAELGAPALVTVEQVRGVRVVAAASPAAEAAGVRAGQKLADARAVCPALDMTEADPGADRAALDRLAADCERCTPLAAADGPDGLWLDVTGCTHLWGGEARFLQRLADWLDRLGLCGRVAVADTPGAAWAAARTVAGAVPVSLAPGAMRAALADLPVRGLRLDAGTVAALWRIGLRTIGDLLRLPRAELSARFGPAPVLRLDQALGDAAEAIPWPHPPSPWEERFVPTEPILAAEDLARALGLVAHALCARLTAADRGGRQFTATFFRVDGARPAIAVGTAHPMRDAAYLAKLLAAKLETVDPGFGVETVRLAADGVTGLPPAQPGLHGSAGAERFVLVVDQLANRLGPDRLWRPMPRATWIPEKVQDRSPPIPVTRRGARPWTHDPGSPRPVRLMRRPEPIQVTASALPDGPPAAFRWRGAPHRVHAATGPERIAREWWRHAPEPGDAEIGRMRDYYQVEDTTGSRFWVFRIGLDGTPRWYLHGLFG